MKFILATKQHMTTLFEEESRAVPVTILHAEPITVTAAKTEERDGYSALQFGAGLQKEQRINKPELGHLKGKGPFKTLREVRTDEARVEGDMVDISVFEVGDKISVAAFSKGKGFQGVVKRHGFSGGPRTHGQAHSEREPGSIGGGLRTRVPKGMRMGGRMGNRRVTVKNLKVVMVDTKNNLLYVRGAVPGKRGTWVEVHGVDA